MNVKANLVWVLAAAMVCSAVMPVWGDDPPNPQVDSVIAAIQQSESAREVSELYGSVASEAPDHVGLRDAYMRRLLALDAIDQATSPARALLRMDRANGLAWSVMAYRYVKDRRLADGFAAMVCSAALIGEEEHLINNIGQWAALLDNEDIEDLDPDAQEQFATFRQQWEEHEAFVAGFERIQGGYDAYHASVNDAEAAVDGIDDQLAEARDEHEAILSEMDEVRELIEEIEDDIDVVRVRRRRRDDDDEYEDGVGYRGDREDIEALNDARAELNELAVEKQEIENRYRALQRERSRAERDLDRAQRNKTRVLRTEDAELVMELAAADVETTGELPEWAEQDVESGRGGAVVAGGGDEPVGGAEEAAGRLLSKARLYLGRDMSAKAKEILETLISDFPDTQAAVTAKELLAGI